MLRKIGITAFMGGISFPITNVIFSSVPQQLAMATGFGAVALLIQFLVDFEKRLAKVEARQVESVTAVQRVVDQGFSKVNKATHLFAQVETAGLQTVAVTNLVQRAAGIGPDVPPLVSMFAQVEIDRVSRFLHELADQEATCDGEDRDWLLGLTRSASHTIDACSIPEVDAAGNIYHSFWDSHLGRHYLDLQREAIQQRGVQIRRIFVTEHDDMADDAILQRVCRTQTDLGIEVRVLHPSAVPRAIRGSHFDFTIFDNAVSYEVTPAAHAEPGESPMILYTRLILRAAKLEERIEKYRSIWACAIPWSENDARTVLPLTSVVSEAGSALIQEGRP